MSCTFISLFFVLATTPQKKGADTARPLLPADVRAALEKNATGFSSLFISGVRTRRSLVATETLLKTLQTVESEGDFTQPIKFELQFQGPRFRESIIYPPVGTSSGKAYTNDSMSETSFDGTKFFQGSRRLTRPDNPGSVYIFTPTIAAAYGKKIDFPEALSSMQFWFLNEIGFSGPMTLGNLGQPVESIILRAAVQGEIVSVNPIGESEKHLIEIVVESDEPWQSKETFEIETDKRYVGMTRGTDKLQMRIERDRRQLVGKKRISRFVLNGEMGYAVQEKWESRKGSASVLFHTMNSKFRKIEADGIWMPMQSDVESFAYDSAPLFVSPHALYETVFHLDICERREFDEEKFRIWYEAPGIQVADYTSPKATIDDADRYQVPASTESLEKGILVSRKGAWFLALNVIGIFVLICFMYIRSRKNAGLK